MGWQRIILSKQEMQNNLKILGQEKHFPVMDFCIKLFTNIYLGGEKKNHLLTNFALSSFPLMVIWGYFASFLY